MEFLRFSGLFSILLILFSSCQQQIRPNRDRYFPTRKDYVTISPYRSPQERSQQKPDLAVGMAISGGGSRAYAFGAGVLLGLEELQNGRGSNYLREVDYISGTSGGIFAAGCYITALHTHLISRASSPFLLANYYDSFIEEALLASYSNPVILGRANLKTMRKNYDHGDLLERKIDNYICGRKLRKRMGLPLESIRLGDIFIPKEDISREVEFPFIVANAAITANIRLFTFAPQTLADYQVSSYVHRMEKYEFDRPIDPYSLPLSVGIKASGTFPGAVMNTTLGSTYNGGKFVHLFDGGLADNVGWRAAIDMLKDDTLAKDKILLIVDVDMNAFPNTFSDKENSGFFLTSLIKTPFSGLDSRRMMRNKEIEEKCKVFGIDPIYLDFTALLKNSSVLPPSQFFVRQERERLIRLIKSGVPLSDLDLQILYELAVNIPTKYTLTPKELEFLITIGKEVVRQQKGNLLPYLDR